MKVVYVPEMRFQHTYKGVATVLEDSELGLLIKKFCKAMSSKKAPEDFCDRMFLGVLKAHLKVYGYPLSLEELEQLSTPDARKIDLLFRGMREVFLKMAKEREKEFAVSD